MRILDWLQSSLQQTKREANQPVEISRLKTDLAQLKLRAETLRAQNRAMQTNLLSALSNVKPPV